jgi:hypothetical protein
MPPAPCLAALATSSATIRPRGTICSVGSATSATST